MRDIKFRAWDEVDQMYYYDIQNGITFDDGSRYTFDQFLNPPTDDYHKWTIEQYTDLKDMMKKEIYEGDFLRNSASIVRQSKARYVVTYDKGGFSFIAAHHRCNRNECPADFTKGSNWEIIGNIHENPDLLEKK